MKPVLPETVEQFYTHRWLPVAAAPPLSVNWLRIHDGVFGEFEVHSVQYSYNRATVELSECLVGTGKAAFLQGR